MFNQNFVTFNFSFVELKSRQVMTTQKWWNAAMGISLVLSQNEFVNINSQTRSKKSYCLGLNSKVKQTLWISLNEQVDKITFGDDNKTVLLIWCAKEIKRATHWVVSSRQFEQYLFAVTFRFSLVSDNLIQMELNFLLLCENSTFFFRQFDLKKCT